MARFNPSKYDPKNDSSTGHNQYRKDGFDGPVLITNEGDCPCGCGTKPNNAKRTFRQGHDARLKGILIRSGATGFKVRLVQDGKVTDKTALQVAQGHGFSDQVKTGIAGAEEKIKARADREAQRKAKATQKKAAKAANSGVAKGDRFPIKMGRWTYEGTVTKVSNGIATLDVERKNDTVEVERDVKDLLAQ